MKYLWFICTFFFSVHAFASTQKNKPIKGLKKQYQFASIQYLIEQEVGRLVLPQIYKSLDINISITPLPAQRAQHVANTGIMSGEIMRIWEYGVENQSTIRVPTPYYYLETMAFTLKGKTIDITNKSELALYRIAKVRGVKHTDKITKSLEHVYEANSTENMFKLLITGQVDVALTNTLDGILMIEKGQFTNIAPQSSPLAYFPLYHYINERDIELVDIIDQEIIRLQQNGQLKSMVKQAENHLIDINTQRK